MIQWAEINPRRITDYNRKMLKESLKQKGIVETPVWNERSGRLVGGHQRIDILDQLEGGTNYRIGVAVVDLTDTEEKELNISLNSGNLQGHYDRDLFTELLMTPKLDLSAIGFSRRDLELEFGSLPEGIFPELAGIPVATQNPPLPAGLQPPASEPTSTPSSPQSSPPSKPDPNSVDAIKQRKQEYKAEDAANPQRDTDYTLLVLFNTQSDRERFLAHNSFLAGLRTLTADELAPLLLESAQWRTDK